GFLLSQIIQDHKPGFTDSGVLECRTDEHGCSPSFPVRRKHPECAFVLASRQVCRTKIVAVGLVDYDAVNHLDDTAFDSLKFVTGSGNHQEQKKVGHGADLNFRLPDTHGFDQNILVSSGFADQHALAGAAGHAAKAAARRRGADKALVCTLNRSMRVLSPRMLPPESGLDGSTLSTATFSPNSS